MGMIRKFEGGVMRLRASGLRIVLFSVLLAGTAPLAAHGQSFEHATKDKVMAALPELETMAQDMVDDDQVPGLSIAVVYSDEVVYLEGFGVREAGTGEDVDADTVFQLASLSKPIASTVVAALVGNAPLVGDKALSWDSRIADIDPTFQLSEAYPTAQVTIRDLFAHRSGLPGNAGNELEQLGYDRDTILHRLRLVKPESSFRSKYSYSNFGLTEGGVAAAKAAGMS
jgi:CubicO group peptidase (beta-lactamase class C family)